MKKILTLLCYISSFSIIAQINFQNNGNVLGLTANTGTSVFGGSGVSFVDYNGDGYDDITLASGDNIPVRFYKNLDGTFFVEESLLPILGDYSYKTRSVTWIDFDNDGDKDLFLTSDTDGNRLFENQNSTLVDVTTTAGFPLDNVHTYGASWGDIDNDGCLDVYLSNRIGDTTITNYLFKNNCDGTFSDVTDSVGLTNSSALTFCSAFFDFNNDGYQDLYVANDKFKPNYLYKNNGDGTFSDISLSSGTDIVVDAMSVTVDDFNSDGFFDIYITNTPNDISTPTLGSILLKNNGDETFSDISVSSGTSLDSFSWGSSFLDADNDGDLDLYVSCQYTQADNLPSYAFYKNDGNELFSSPTDVGFANNDYKSYACAIGDYNNDGKQDIIVNNDANEAPSLWTHIKDCISGAMAEIDEPFDTPANRGSTYLYFTSPDNPQLMFTIMFGSMLKLERTISIAIELNGKSIEYSKQIKEDTFEDKEKELIRSDFYGTTKSWAHFARKGYSISEEEVNNLSSFIKTKIEEDGFLSFYRKVNQKLSESKSGI